MAVTAHGRDARATSKSFTADPVAPEEPNGKLSFKRRGHQEAAEVLNVIETKGDSRGRRKSSKMHVNEIKRVNSNMGDRVHHGESMWKMKVYPFGLLKTKETINGFAKIRSYP